jgi:hypothetical protein
LITYRVKLDVPVDLVLFVSRLLAGHRRQIGTRKGTRSLGCYRQALFALAWFRDRTGRLPVSSEIAALIERLATRTAAGDTSGSKVRGGRDQPARAVGARQPADPR